MSKNEEKKPTAKEEKAPSLKDTYAALFARDYERFKGKPYKGDPTAEAAGDRPELVKYYQNWLKFR